MRSPSATHASDRQDKFRSPLRATWRYVLVARSYLVQLLSKPAKFVLPLPGHDVFDIVLTVLRFARYHVAFRRFRLPGKRLGHASSGPAEAEAAAGRREARGQLERGCL